MRYQYIMKYTQHLVNLNDMDKVTEWLGVWIRIQCKMIADVIHTSYHVSWWNNIIETSAVNHKIYDTSQVQQ